MIADPQALDGDFAGALKTAASIEEASAKARTLGAIAAEQAMAGDAAGATQTLELALQTAAAMWNADGKALVLIDISEAQAKGEGLSGAFKTANTIEDGWREAMAERAIAEKQAKARDFAGG